MAHETDTLCFSCKTNVCDCCWMQKLKPVPDWTAYPDEVKNQGRPVQKTYFVVDCPLYTGERTDRPSFKAKLERTYKSRAAAKIRLLIRQGIEYIAPYLDKMSERNREFIIDKNYTKLSNKQLREKYGAVQKFEARALGELNEIYRMENESTEI